MIEAMRWLLLVLAVACGRIDFDVRTGDGGDGPVCTSGAWGNPQRLVALESAEDDWGPALSDDGLVLVFDSSRGGFDDLYVATRTSTSAMFDTAPERIPNLSTMAANEYGAAWHGSDLYYSYFDRNTFIGGELFASYIGGHSFGDALAVQREMPGDAIEIANAGLELFYNINPSVGQYVLKHASRTAPDADWQPDGSLDFLTPQNTSAGWASLDDARQTLYFERTVGTNDPEIAFTTRADYASPFGPAQPLTTIGPRNGDPEISRDGTTMIFASDRQPTLGLNDLWIATRSCQ